MPRGSIVVYPPPISADEKKMLRILSGRSFHDPIEWSRFEMRADLPPSIFGDGIAHLVRARFIDTADAQQGIIKNLLGIKGDVYVFITPEGQTYIEKYGNSTVEQDAAEVELNATPEDKREMIEEAVLAFESSFSRQPSYSAEKIKAAAERLDDDIKQEIKIGAIQKREMWEEYEARFGGRDVDSSEEASSLRDPVVRDSAVRMFRAMDEQLKRLNLPISRKPGTWETRFKAGNVGLEPAPWEASSSLSPSDDSGTAPQVDRSPENVVEPDGLQEFITKISQDLGIDLPKPSENSSRKETLEAQIQNASIWIAREAFNLCSNEQKKLSHYELATLTTAIVVCGHLVSKDESLDFEGTSMKVCISLMSQMQSSLDFSMVGKAINIYNNPQFRDDIGYIGEQVVAIVDGESDHGLNGVCAALSELAEELDFARRI